MVLPWKGKEYIDALIVNIHYSDGSMIGEVRRFGYYFRRPMPLDTMKCAPFEMGSKAFPGRQANMRNGFELLGHI